MFKKGKLYRHCNPNASLDIEVVNVLKQDNNFAALKIRYVTRLTKRYQYTGKGSSGITDIVEVKDPKNWEELNA